MSGFIMLFLIGSVIGGIGVISAGREKRARLHLKNSLRHEAMEPVFLSLPQPKAKVTVFVDEAGRLLRIDVCGSITHIGIDRPIACEEKSAT